MTETEFALELRAAGLRRRELARLTGRDRQTVWRWITGRTQPPEYAVTIVRLHRRIRELSSLNQHPPGVSLK